jgi:hypothetical protein
MATRIGGLSGEDGSVFEADRVGRARPFVRPSADAGEAPQPGGWGICRQTDNAPLDDHGIGFYRRNIRFGFIRRENSAAQYYKGSACGSAKTRKTRPT